MAGSRRLSCLVSVERKNPFGVCFRSSRSTGWIEISHHKNFRSRDEGSSACRNGMEAIGESETELE
jgi:hypothetical protein